MSEKSTQRLILMQYAGPVSRLVVLFCAMLVMLTIVNYINQLFMQHGGIDRNALLIVSALQNILAFAAPTIAVAWLVSAKPWDWCGLSRQATPISLFGMLIILVLAMPAMNQIIFWNEHFQFPDSASAIEQTLRKMESDAAAFTDRILDVESVGAMIVNVLIVGCLTGLCEELFFRAGLQKILSERLNIHIAVWVSAFVFSVMHFQFFGFLPRLLLGAFFGYLYAASGSVWLNGAAHALNNSIVVVTVWLSHRMNFSMEPEMWGAEASGFPLIATISAAATALMIVAMCKHRVFNNNSAKWQKNRL